MRCLRSPGPWVAGWFIALTPTAFVPTAWASGPQPSPAARDSFEKTIRPIFASHCFECHGPDKQRGKLRLDSRSAMLKGGESGPAIVPGAPEKSLLLKALRYDDEELKMPPKGPLGKSEIAALSAWIQQGAHWP